MDWHDNLRPVSECEAFAAFLTNLGYDGAKRTGLLRQYMKMLNTSRSGGYTEFHIKEAEISDSIVFSAEWRRASINHMLKKQKAPN